jgi:oxygen-independent coproporphyrinogen-3 oxidase
MKKETIIREAVRKAASFNIPELIGTGFIPKNGLFAPTVIYPSMVTTVPLTEEEFFADKCSGGPFLIYTHIPFCVKRCLFCHFVTRTGVTSSEKDDYLSAVEKEIDLFRVRLGLDLIPVAAICIGGGTATDMEPVQLECFLKAFTSRLDLSACSQFTLDTDPTTILNDEGRRKLDILLKYGADRITIGVQLLDDKILTSMNRAHTSEEALLSIKAARQAGFRRICADLIFGYPGQSIESWIDTVDATINSDADALQIFQLRVRPQSLNDGQIWKHFQDRPGLFPSPEETMRLKAAAILMAQNAGYGDEENINLFSKKDASTSQYHQRKFIKQTDVLGFGMAAQSTLGQDIGIKETKSMERYMREVHAGHIPIVRGKKGTADDALRRAVIYTLRNRRSLSKAEYRLRTGKDINEVFGAKITSLIKYGLLKDTEDHLELTEKGYYFADTVCMQFNHPDHMQFGRDAYYTGPLNPYNT